VYVLDVPVVVLAIDEIVELSTIRVSSTVKEIPDAIRFLTDVVAAKVWLVLDFNVYPSKTRAVLNVASTYSCLVNSSKCLLAKLTGCAPGKPKEFLSNSEATSSLKDCTK
jgi:hypothetical protein